MEREGLTCSVHWLQRAGTSKSASRQQVRDWVEQTVADLQRRPPGVVLLHYSVFAYSYRGVPAFVRPVLAGLRRLGVPVIAVMHELAYPWGLGGWRGKVWAVTQRAALIAVMRTIDAAIVTTDLRARWLSSRVWLARRRVETAPVFSNLPAASGRSRPRRDGFALGLFGYSHLENSVSVVLDSLRLLRREGRAVELVLLGSPGRDSPSGDAWVAQARSRDVEASLSFSGTLAPQALSNALADCDVLLCAYTAGPSSRKGSLAASLASGRPVVVLDGPGRWLALVESGAAGVARPTADALYESIRALLSDEALREELGARGRLFAERRMGVAVTAAAVTALLEEVLAEDGAVQDAVSARTHGRSAPRGMARERERKGLIVSDRKR